MSKFKRRSHKAMSILALGCLVLRSLVAPGFMLVADPVATGNLALVLCPAQNRNINFQRLSSGDARHDHAHHGAEHGESSSRSTHDHGGPLHTESLDSSCGLWSGSATASLATGSFDPISFGIADARISPPPRYFSSLKFSPSQARAPPSV
ncbi:MAG: hypothetical protein O3C28_15630 [Proteobacteria bacterium]|nr:hypothetical protein [Pseudomonadota bacterium]